MLENMNTDRLYVTRIFCAVEKNKQKSFFVTRCFNFFWIQWEL